MQRRKNGEKNFTEAGIIMATHEQIEELIITLRLNRDIDEALTRLIDLRRQVRALEFKIVYDLKTHNK